MKWRCVGKGGKAAERAGAEGRGTQVGCSMRAGGLLLFSLIPHLLGGEESEPRRVSGSPAARAGRRRAVPAPSHCQEWWLGDFGGDCPGADTWG